MRARSLARLGAAAWLCGLVAMVPQVHGKGINLRLTADAVEPRIGEQVRVSIRGRFDDGVTGRCRRMRVVVVAPGVSVKAALRSLEGQTPPRRIGEWDAFRLASMWTFAIRASAGAAGASPDPAHHTQKARGFQ